MATGGHGRVKERHEAGTVVKGGAALGDAESANSIATTRYVLVGDQRTIDNFCQSKFGKAPDALPNIRIVTRHDGFNRVRTDATFGPAEVIFLRGWSRMPGMASEVLAFQLAEFDRRR